MAMTELVTRINRIFESILGCRLEFKPAHALSSDDWKASDLDILRDKRAAPPKFVQSPQTGMFGFPVNVRGSFAGLAIVKGIENAKSRKLFHMAELFSLVLEAGLQQDERRERLQMIEERLHLMDEKSNVIPLRPARFGKVVELVDSTQLNAPSPTPLTSLPLLIQTAESFPLNRVAIEIHGQSNRWAFVSIDDLPEDVFASREGIEALGSMTIFIKDIAALTAAQQQGLSEYLLTEPASEKPQVIAGANVPAEHLRAAGLVRGDLLDRFCISNLNSAGKTPQQVTSDFVSASLHQLLEKTREHHKTDDHIIPFHIKYFDSESSLVH
jgi:hypothetical protein